MFFQASCLWNNDTEMTKQEVFLQKVYALQFHIQRQWKGRYSVVLQHPFENNGIFCELLTLAIFIFLTYASVLFANTALVSGQLAPSLQIPIFYVYLAVPVSFAFCVIRQAQVILMEYVFHDNEEVEEGVNA